MTFFFDSFGKIRVAKVFMGGQNTNLNPSCCTAFVLTMKSSFLIMPFEMENDYANKLTHIQMSFPQFWGACRTLVND